MYFLFVCLQFVCCVLSVCVLAVCVLAVCVNSALSGDYFFVFTVHFTSIADPEPGEPKLFWDLEPEPEPKINFNKHFLQSVWRMLE